MIHIKELVARRTCVYGGQGSNGFRGMVIQYRDGIGGLSMKGEKYNTPTSSNSTQESPVPMRPP